MKVIIETRTAIKVEGGKSGWNVPTDCVVDCDGLMYVKIPPGYPVVVKMLCEGAAHAPDPVPKDFSLLASVGYRHLVEIRNQTQSDELVEDRPSTKLFRSEDQQQQPKKRRLTRDRINELRQSPTALTIKVPTEHGDTDVSVLRPIHPKDALAVQLAPDQLSAVFAHIRNSQFDDTTYYKRDKTLPKGIWRKAGAYIVKYLDADGKERSHGCATIDEAITFQEDNPYTVEQCNGDGKDDPTDDVE